MRVFPIPRPLCVGWTCRLSSSDSHLGFSPPKYERRSEGLRDGIGSPLPADFSAKVWPAPFFSATITGVSRFLTLPGKLWFWVIGSLLELIVKGHPMGMKQDRVAGAMTTGMAPPVRGFNQFATRHGEVVVQALSASMAQALDLPLWQDVQGLGMPVCSVSTGLINRNV